MLDERGTLAELLEKHVSHGGDAERSMRFAAKRVSANITTEILPKQAASTRGVSWLSGFHRVLGATTERHRKVRRAPGSALSQHVLFAPF